VSGDTAEPASGAVRSSEQGAESAHFYPMLFRKSLTAGTQILVEENDRYGQRFNGEEGNQQHCLTFELLSLK
jgi:hypothetical protein